jgi:hypothetical protein
MVLRLHKEALEATMWKKSALIALLFWTSSSHASCKDLLSDAFWKIANGAKTLVGFNQVLQEDVPLGQQLIAKQGFGDHAVAWDWILRELDYDGTVLQIIRGGPPLRTNHDLGIHDDIYSDIANFILTVPNWKSVTNKQMRVFVEMDRVLTFLEKQIPGSRMPAHSDWTYSQRDEWNRLFPNRQLGDELEALHLYHPG